MNSDRRFRESMAKLVKLMGRESVPVNFAGNQAYVSIDTRTDKVQHVNLPNIATATKKMQTAMIGYVNHEAGHILYSSGKETRKAIQEAERNEYSPKLAGYVNNAIEDARMENELVKSFPGARSSLDETFRMVMEEFEPHEDMAPSTIIMPFLRARSGQSAAQEWIDQQPEFVQEWVAKLDAGFPDIADQLKAIKDPKGTSRLTQKVLERLYEKAPPPPPPPPPMPSDCESTGKSDGSKDDEDEPGEVADDQNDDGSVNSDTDDDRSEEDGDDVPDDSSGDEDGESDVSEDDASEDDTSGSSDDDWDKDKSDTGSSSKDGNTSEDEEGDEKDEGSASGDAEDESETSEDESSEGSPSDSESLEGSDDADQSETVLEGGGQPIDETDDFLDLADFTDEEGEIDFDEVLADIITKGATDSFMGASYAEYTTQWDVLEVAPFDPSMKTDSIQEAVNGAVAALKKRMVRMVAAQRSSRHIGGYKRGRINGSALHRVKAGDDRVFTRKHVQKEKDTAFSLVVDLSGSMNWGRKLPAAIEGAWAFSQVLTQMGVANEVLGFTTHVENIGQVNRADVRRKIREFAAATGLQERMVRIEPLHTLIFKGFDEGFTPDVRKRLAYQHSGRGTNAGNADAASLKVALRRLQAYQAERHVMIVFSDGAPSPEWGGEYEAAELKRVVEQATLEGVDMVGIGIKDHSVKRFYPRNVVVHNVDDLSGQVLKEIERFLAK